MIHGELSNVSKSFVVGIRMEDTVFDLVKNDFGSRLLKGEPKHSITLLTNAVTVCAEIMRRVDMDIRYILGKEYKDMIPDIVDAFENSAIGLHFDSVFLVGGMNEIAVYVANGTFRYYIDNDDARRQKVYAPASYSMEGFKQILFRR